MNVLQSMLVYCIVLDEHVTHKPQFILYFQHKLTWQKGEISRSDKKKKSLLISVSFSTALFGVFWFSVSTTVLTTYMRFATESIRVGELNHSRRVASSKSQLECLLVYCSPVGELDCCNFSISHSSHVAA